MITQELEKKVQELQKSTIDSEDLEDLKSVVSALIDLVYKLYYENMS